jgi:branched-chain amino acid transport system ATP-binding protein
MPEATPEPAAPIRQPVLNAGGLSKNFGGKKALQAVSLRLEHGSIHGLIGPNGAGKSTLIGVLAGTVVPDEGEITLAGAPLGRATPRRRARDGLGRTFQTPHVFDSLTLRQHILLGARDGGWGFEAAAHLGLDPLLDRAVATFSHGLRRLAEICHVAAYKPRVLLLDEPAAGLTMVEMRQLDAALRWLQPRLAVCLVEHNMTFLLGIADTITVLDHGQVIASGSPDAIVAEPAVREAYLGVSFARH